MEVERMKYHPGWVADVDLGDGDGDTYQLWEPHNGKPWQACRTNYRGGEDIDGAFTKASTPGDAMRRAQFPTRVRAAFEVEVNEIASR